MKAESGKLKNPIVLAGSFVLILAAVFCTVGAITSAFSFAVDNGLLLFIWVLAALSLSVLSTLWRVKGILALVPLALAIIIWKLPEIVEGGKWAAFFISREFNKWLFVPVFFSDAKATAYEITIFFATAGTILTFLLAGAICLRRSAFLAFFLTAPFVFITFVLIHSKPDTKFLIGLLAVYFTLLISSALHNDDFHKRGKAIFPSLALALLLLGIAYLIAPSDGYRRERHTDMLDFQLRSIASRVGLAQVKFGVGWPLASSGIWRFDTNNVEISDAGTRVITDQDVLEVTTSEPGTFYLRGFSMQHFDGERWTVNTDTLYIPNETFAMEFPYWIAGDFIFSFQLDPGAVPVTVKRATMTVEKIFDATPNVQYVPYYSSRHTSFSQQDREFLYVEGSILEIPTYSHSSIASDALISFGRQSREVYTQVEGSTAEGLRQLAIEAGVDIDADREVIVDQVAEYIRSSGRYTLSPYVIPADEDFALYFLQESRQGYCIHFATAAILMLRALDVPARFVSGFAVIVPEENVGKPFRVTDRNAHAWVEVFYSEAGWVPLEVTPAAAGSNIPGVRFHTPIGLPTPDADTAGRGGVPGQLEERDWGDSPFLPPGTGSDADDKGAEAEERDRLRETRIIITIAFIACVAISAMAVAVHRPLARLHRKKSFEQKDTNAAVISAWRYITRLDKKKELPEDIEDLALKARFSQHALSEGERIKMTSYATMLADDAYFHGGTLGRFLLYVRGL